MRQNSFRYFTTHKIFIEYIVNLDINCGMFAQLIRYGDGVGLYRTHLFGSPTIIACTPSTNKFVFQTEASFRLEWASAELVGSTSLVAVEGASHTRVRSVVVRAINQPDVLRKITLMLQPRLTAALKLWSQKGRIRAYDEARKVK